jgi:hypothetical protein
MNESDGTNTSGSEPPEDLPPQDDVEGDPNLSIDAPTVSYEIPFRTFAGIRDPSSKALGAGISLAAITAAFRTDSAMKEFIADGAVIVGSLVSAYGPRVQIFLLGWNEERIAEGLSEKLDKLAAAHPNDTELQKKARSARETLADGWLSRIKRSIKPTSNTASRKPERPDPKAKKPK